MDEVASRTYARSLFLAVAVAIATMIAAGLMDGPALARGVTGRPRPAARVAVAAPCAAQGSCQYCAPGGVSTGNCTRSKLEYNVAWCGRNKRRLSAANKAKCAAEARYLGWGPADQLLPWIEIICAPPNARTIYLAVTGAVEETGPIGLACAGISVYAGLRSLVFKLV
ncbi:MAG: hypothetical protein ABSG43_12980 [Solirubrobacteraceae bacterium]